jgi:hypothetical protein
MAPVLYEIFLAQRAMGQTEAMMGSLQELAGLKVSPWSEMAQSLLSDYKLQPELDRLGRQLQEAGGRN